MKSFLLLANILIVLSSCSSTQIISTWREPNKEVNLNKLNKVLVVALFQNETTRRKVEDQLVGYLNGKGVASYDYLDRGISETNEGVIREKIKKDGFEGAVTMRLLDVDKEKAYTRSNIALYPSYYNNFSGYYYRNWPFYFDSGYYLTTKIYTVETNVFSIKEDKIIWTGITKTTDPSGVVKMTEEIGQAVFNKMLKEGFISDK
ncbi:hypothetical protein VB264_21815 [Arcicella aquatica]|uniref:DUF4136 domain-containing protein n=1 Tax=Arcicella aquatica TaxID=217141 RepID=A0ABU5QUV6_9BACT|nr:hypothetical protein [Arcicella aquatica]MEA5260449.1 hypothetical protein [Arcicella aquatica]